MQLVSSVSRPYLYLVAAFNLVDFLLLFIGFEQKRVLPLAY